MKIAIIAALPSELKPLVRKWSRQASKEPYVEMWTYTDQAGDELVAVCAGMGAECARKAFSAAEANGAIDLIISAGIAGATVPEGRAGDCWILSEIIDVKTGEHFSLTDGKRKLRIATTAQVADREEKHRLRQSYGAVMVDMEAATIARLAEMRNIPMCCIKAISDGVDANIPDLNRFIFEGQLRLAAFLFYVMWRPRYWSSLIALGRGSALASKALAVTLGLFLLDKNWERANRTGHVGAEV